MAIVAVVGMSATGKSEAVDHLMNSHRMQRIYFGGYVLKEVQARGLQESPENERLVREEMRRIDGMAAIAKRAMPDLKAALRGSNSIVIDGLYSYAEYELLYGEFENSLAVIAFHCDRRIREERAKQRSVRPLSASELLNRDRAEIKALEKGGPIAIADYHILNNGTRESFKQKIEEVLKYIFPV